MKNITNGFKIIITKTTHVHRITRTGRYLTLIFLINNRNCNIKSSLVFKGLLRIERDSSNKGIFHIQKYNYQTKSVVNMYNLKSMFQLEKLFDFQYKLDNNILRK